MMSAGVTIKNKGCDTKDRLFDSIDAMWATVKDDWYAKGVKYWQDIPADYNGVLGGYDFTHDIDIEDNDRLVKLLQDKGLKFGRALGKI